MRHATALPLTLISFSLLPLMGSCAGRPFTSDIPKREPVCVVVENYHFNDVRVYAERDGVRHRLGTVEGMNTKEFRIPDRVLAGAWRFSLAATPLASSDVAESPSLELIPGCRTHWKLGQSLSISQVEIR